MLSDQSNGERKMLSCPQKHLKLFLFYEYFDEDAGKGLGASHQTGLTALVVRCI